MPHERIASSDTASRMLPQSGTYGVLGDEPDELAGMSFSILHFLLGGSLLHPVQLNELETVKSGADLGSSPAF